MSEEVVKAYRLILFVFLCPATGYATSTDAQLVEAACSEVLAGAPVSGGGVGSAVVGIIDRKGNRLLRGCGHAREGGPPPDGQTQFEIGSITKVFTSLVLADLVVHHFVALDDPIDRFLPSSVHPPSFNGHHITLIDLATHTAHLPRFPLNVAPRDPGDPYADYDVAALYAFLASHMLEQAPGKRYEYSNLGVGLLGHVLALAAKKSYAELVARHVTGPLAMHATTLNDAPPKHASDGHAQDGGNAHAWHLGVLAPAGGLRSNVDDMLAFVRAQFVPPSSLRDAIALTQQPRRDAGEGMRVGLGWHFADGNRVVWHSGLTGGYTSFMGFVPANRVGVVILVSRFDAPAERVGFALIDELRGRVEDALRR
jgi:serine-type D-Ala-D-Ala carboxypeptidase/endopeptidase